MKFFKQTQKKCTLCNNTPIYKTVRSIGKRFDYCEQCYQKEYKHSYDFVIKKVESRKAQGKKIGLTQTKQLVQEIIDDKNKQPNTIPAQPTAQSTT